MKQAVVYVRVSTDEQAKNSLSLKGQEDAAREYCERENIDVAKVFCDAGESAKTANRPQLIAALAYCKEHFSMTDYFVVWKMDRLARQAYDSAIIDAELKKYGIELRSVTEPITESPIGNLTKTMLAGFAQFDNEVRAERSSAGAKRRLEEGGWTYVAPLGYKNQKDALRRPTLVTTDIAPVITKWLRTYLNTEVTLKSMNELAWKLGITRNGNRLSYQQTCNMLRNPIYAGYIRSSAIPQPVQGLHVPLITPEEHELIIRKLDNKAHAFTREVKEDWSLRGFLICGYCKRKLTGSSPRGRKKKYPLYHCVNCKAKDVGGRVSVGRETAHEQFSHLLASITPSESALSSFKSVFIQKWAERQKNNTESRLVLQRDIESLKNKKTKVTTLFVDGLITLEEKREQSKLIDGKLIELELMMNECREVEQEISLVTDFGTNMIKEVPKLWRTADLKGKSHLQYLIFPNGIEYYFEKGFGTAKMGPLYEVVSSFDNKNSNVVGVAGLEPATNRL